MNNENLRESLEELHFALLQMAPAEKSLQEKRDSLASQIRETLDQEDLGGFHLSLKEILDQEIISFEAEHPKVTQLMLGVRDILSSIGI